MFKTVEGIYKKGKIHISKLIDIGDETRVLIVFADDLGKSGKPAGPTVETHFESFGPEELRLEDVDVTIGTKGKYLKELSGPVRNSESAFFSSKPIDIGYTDANMTDSLIADSEK